VKSISRDNINVKLLACADASSTHTDAVSAAADRAEAAVAEVDPKLKEGNAGAASTVCEVRMAGQHV